MYTLMNDVSDIYNKCLVEYADKQEIFDIKVYVSIFLFIWSLIFVTIHRINSQYILDNIASCLFGIETNSLQNENVTLIKHLKKIFSVNLANLFVLVICKCI